MTYKIPKPDWQFEYDEPNETVSLKPYIDKVTQRVWEIEESVLTGAVVDLLREKGYTVIEPGVTDVSQTNE